jgi:HSP20 family protein
MKNEHKELIQGFSQFPSFLDPFQESKGVSLSEDDKHVYVEAAVPGMNPEEIEMTYDKGILLIKAEKKEESSDKNKKFYHKAYQKFFYQVAVPGHLDEAKNPEATCKDGIVKISFIKAQPDSQRKKISIKKG